MTEEQSRRGREGRSQIEGRAEQKGGEKGGEKGESLKEDEEGNGDYR